MSGRMVSLLDLLLTDDEAGYKPRMIQPAKVETMYSNSPWLTFITDGANFETVGLCSFR